MIPQRGIQSSGIGVPVPCAEWIPDTWEFRNVYMKVPESGRTAEMRFSLPELCVFLIKEAFYTDMKEIYIYEHMNSKPVNTCPSKLTDYKVTKLFLAFSLSGFITITHYYGAILSPYWPEICNITSTLWSPYWTIEDTVLENKRWKTESCKLKRKLTTRNIEV